MAQTRNTFVTNFPLVAPLASPAMTIGPNLTIFSYQYTVVQSSNPLNSLEILLEVSHDGGQTWGDVRESLDLPGGTITRGPNIGQPGGATVSGELVNLIAGDRVRAQATICTSAGTTLAGAVNSNATMFQFTDTGGIVNGSVILLGTEQVQVTSGGGTTSATVTRGFNGTAKASHANGASVLLPWMLTASVTVQ